MTSFNYSPLEFDRPSIRLLRLQKTSKDVYDYYYDIQCNLFHAWIDEPASLIPYEALSYTWGSETKPCTITIDRKRFAVTWNLYEALQCLRSEIEDRILWIDAVCIHQENEKELTHQVKHMSQIYKSAERVLMWLGPSTEAVDTLMYFMKSLQLSPINLSSNAVEDVVRVSERRDLIPIHMKGLETLFERPYFRRAWILQEVANARSANIVCGEHSVSAQIFAAMPKALHVAPNSLCQAILDIMLQ